MAGDTVASAAMRLVVDTNVLVSALLHAGRVPDRCVEAICARGDVVLYDDRIVSEYQSVLRRPKFRAPEARVVALLDAVLARGARVEVTAPFDLAMIDPDDRMFVEVARAGGADAIVTGNAKHFPESVGVEVLGPAALLARYGAP